jgi:hypothetical protein
MTKYDQFLRNVELLEVLGLTQALDPVCFPLY